MAKLILTVGSRFCGEFPPPAHYSLEYQIAWYCWRCGEVYARRQVIGGNLPPWDFHYGICLECCKYEDIPSGGWWQFFRCTTEVLNRVPVHSIILAEEFMFNYDMLIGVPHERSGSTPNSDPGPRYNPDFYRSWSEDLASRG